MDKEFSTVQQQDVREYWEDEAQEFTPWLADQIRREGTSHLEDILGLDLEVVDTEKKVGRYSLDILAEAVDEGKKIVIENQLGSSNHDHLGKSIAYASGVDADVVVWISPQFNDEHRDAVQWLNKNSREEVDLFAINLEVWKIGDSDPAVRLNPVVEPSEWTKKAKRSRGELTETKKLQEEFWTVLRDNIQERETPLRARKANPRHWYSNPIGRSGFHLSFKINTREDRMYCTLIISDDAESYQALKSQRYEIEEEIGTDLEWVPPSDTDTDKDRSKIRIWRESDIEDKDSWEEYLNWTLDMGERFHNAFYDRIQTL